MRKIESKIHPLMNLWTTTKETFYSLYVKFVNQNLTHIHKMSVKFVNKILTQRIKAPVNPNISWKFFSQLIFQNKTKKLKRVIAMSSKLHFGSWIFSFKLKIPMTETPKWRGIECSLNTYKKTNLLFFTKQEVCLYCMS